MKSTKINYHLKFKDKIVDAAANSEFIFNKTPILVPLLKEKQQPFKNTKRDRSNKNNLNQDQFNKHQKKKVKNQQESKTYFQNQFYTPLQSDIYTYFKTTKITCKNVEEVPQPKFQVGSYVLTAICDRGIGGKYLVTNFSRNRKGYIDYKQLSYNHDPNAISLYNNPGQFIVAEVIKGENIKNIQLKLTAVNNNLNEKQIRIGQILPGQIKSKEQLGSHIDIGKKTNFRFFLPKAQINEQIYESLPQNKQILFSVSQIQLDKKLIKLNLLDNNTNINFRGIQQQELSKFDLQAYILPGTKVNTMILKKLSNGVIVKFLKIFYGYIFVDHLSNSLDTYNVGDKFECRIIHFCNNPPTIYLSQKHQDISIYDPKYELYTAIKKPEDIQQIQGVYISKIQNIMMHPLHCHTTIQNIQKLWIKQNNYFEKYQIVSSKKLGLRVGQLSKIIPFQNFKVYGKGSGKFRVMCLDVWNKVLKVSYEPLIISQKDKQLKSIDQIDISKQYVGFISTISNNGIIVQFQNNIKGLLNSYQIKSHGGDLNSYKVGSAILVFIKTVKQGLLQLALSLSKKQYRKRKQSALSQQSIQEGTKMALISSINSKSIRPIYLKVKKTLIPLSIFKNICLPQELQSLLPLEDHFKVNDRIKAYKKGSEYYLYPPEQMTNPNLKICRIVGIKQPYARIQVDKDKFGSVHITQISDMILPNPIYTQLKLGEYRVCRQLQDGYFTLRESIIKDGIPSNMKQCITKYGQRQKNGDYRNRMLVFPDGNGLKAGMLFIGYVKVTNKNGCFISLTKNYQVRVQLSELSDQKIKDPIKQFYQNRLVFGRLILEKIKPNEPNKKFFDASLRESIVKYGYQLNLDTFRVGLTVEGTVIGYTKGNALVAIQGSKYRGIISPKNLKQNKNEESLQKNLPEGLKLKCKIIAFQKQPKLLIKLSNLDKHFKQYEDVKIDIQNNDLPRIQGILDSIKQLNEKYHIQLKNKQQQLNQVNLQEKQNEEEQYQRIKRLLIQKGMDQESDEEQLIQQINQQKQQQQQQQNQNAMQQQQNQQEQEENIQIQNQIQPQQNQPQTDLNKFEEYKSKLTPLPHSSSHYHALLLSSPTFQTHLMYISSLLQQKQPEDIRYQFLRSINMLKTIEQKQNMWIAWINMETILGDLMGTVKKAIQNGVGEKVYFRVIQILIEQNKWDVAIQFSRAMVKKWSGNIKVWINFLKTIILYQKQHNLPQNLQPKELLRRASQSLPAKDHILIETQYGKLEYQIGEPEKGRNMFELIISRYPKRTDIWSVYIDMQIKYGDKSKCRNIFQRAISLKLKSKKMKFFFKKYLKFVQENGTKKEVEQILQKANQYARQHLNVGQQEQESQEEQNKQQYL